MARPIDTAKPGRRLLMLTMIRGGMTVGEVASHFRYTRRHVSRELAEARRAERSERIAFDASPRSG